MTRFALLALHRRHHRQCFRRHLAESLCLHGLPVRRGRLSAVIATAQPRRQTNGLPRPSPASGLTWRVRIMASPRPIRPRQNASVFFLPCPLSILVRRDRIALPGDILFHMGTIFQPWCRLLINNLQYAPQAPWHHSKKPATHLQWGSAPNVSINLTPPTRFVGLAGRSSPLLLELTFHKAKPPRLAWEQANSFDGVTSSERKAL